MSVVEILLAVSIMVSIGLGGLCFYLIKVRYDGTLDVENFPDGGKRYSLNLDTDLDALDNQKRIILRINPIS
jgi:hypothetical protein